MVIKYGKYKAKSRFFQSAHFLICFCQVDGNCFQRDLELAQHDLEVLQRDLESREMVVKVGPGHRSAAEAEPAEGGRLRLRALKGLVTLFSTPCYLLTRCGGLIGYRLCRRPLRLESPRLS